MWTFILLLFWGCRGICSYEIFTSTPPESSTQHGLLNLTVSAFDVDECADPRACPEHATCHNSPGSYYCVCNSGFVSSSGNTTFRGPGETCEDVNECANSTICPANATCTNTLDSYYCTCEQGFLSSTGETQFVGPGVECKDIDECSQSPLQCGLNSVCQNLPGRYECSCLPGFSSPTGNNWNSGNPGHFACTDVDECPDPRVCPEHATCHNSPGSYYCVCNSGFLSRNRSMSSQGLGETCEDVDECVDPRACPEHATCHNSPGSYYCACNPGFVSSSGNTTFRSLGETCEDVNECANSTICPANATCTNTLDSYYCTCKQGFLSSTGETQFVGPGVECKVVPFKCKEAVLPNNKQVRLCQEGAVVEPEYVSFCALMNTTFSILDDACENKATVVSLKNTAESVTSVLEQTSTWSNFTKEETSTLATVLLETVESTTLAAFLKSSENVSQSIQTEHLDINTQVINKECSEESTVFNLKAKGDEMKIWCSTIKESESTGTTGVAFVSFAGMESVLDESFFQDPRAPLGNSRRKLKMNSRIAGGIMTGKKKDGFSNPVIYTLENTEPKQKSEDPICVSWTTDAKGGRWTPSGCEILEASETHTVCSCNRMANLAIIMASRELTMDFSLYIISHVGMIISLVCLVLAIATFLLCRSIRNHNTYLHLHLCVCLFLAKMLFLTGVDKTDNQTGCAIIAGFLHYLFLACFFWMLVEAVMLFLMVRNLKVVNYFSSRNIKMTYLCVFGYGLPAVVVAVSAGVQPQGYGMYDRCWLNTEAGFIWSFLGPVCTIIVINSILFTLTLRSLRQKLSSVNAEVSTLKNTRLLTFKAFAQLFILGSSWVLGIFQIGPMASIMAYLFTIINSLQGAFIFLIHCLLNRQVREDYRRWITRKTTPRSQSQTSGVILTSFSSTSNMG
ncbi:adhesion G protein-coupled receptor E1-like isoform X2 [Diceros bicornis minor]|uniref:adhesion G protein-coupled receptor E1-like isoform X2 n=1 Tax=Diceros bicornis minor TaxID=77932 RepID=UPI0026F282CB|nr:adhesion G protein-coupled receptor E1-like isoform X2 [Diceros bicornis minor]